MKEKIITKKLKKSDKKALNERMSKFFERITELVFAGVILSGILKEDINLGWLVVGGVTSIVILLIASYMTFLNSRK